ncbi:MAG: hypothetical protein ACRCUM_03045 [Mycoplasmoidaceae bacterium]
MSKFKNFFVTFFTVLISVFITFPLSSCGLNSNKIYFGNFQSYMSPDVMNNVYDKYNLDFKSYINNEALLREFQKNYDIAIPSSYAAIELIEKGELLPIDWSKFNISSSKSETGIIKNASEALDLFIPEIHAILTGYDFNNDGIKDNLLEYAVPYFLQDFILGYKSEQIEFSEVHYDNWEKVLINLKKELSNSNISRGISIDDPRTIYSLARLISDPNNDVNPSKEENTIDHFKEFFSFLPKYFGKNEMIFNSDSGNVLNDLAHPNGSGFGFMYNGDVLYSMFGGDSKSDNLSDINFIRPTTGSNIALDMIVINKKSESNSDIIHEIINDIALKGIVEIDNFDDSSLAYLNFDYVMYTSPIKIMYDYVIDPIDGYFSEEEDVFRDKVIATFKVPSIDPLKRIENKITNLQKSNMLIAYLFTKNSI